MKNVKEKIYGLLIVVMALFLVYSAFDKFTAPEDEITAEDFNEYEQQ